MNAQELKNHLADTVLFSEVEIDRIVRTCGTYTLGNAVIACEILGITLTGTDVDDIFSKDSQVKNYQEFPGSMKHRVYSIHKRKGIVITDGFKRFSLKSLKQISLNRRLSFPHDLFVAINEA